MIENKKSMYGLKLVDGNYISMNDMVFVPVNSVRGKELLDETIEHHSL